MEVGNASVTGQLQELGEKKIATSKEQSTNNTIKTNSIYVRGYFNNVQSELVEYFSTFGKVTRSHFGSGFAFVDFIDPNVVEQVMAVRDHIFKGRRIIVRYSRSALTVSVNNEEIQENIHQTIVSKLEQLDDFNREFDCLSDILQPNLSARYDCLCSDLYKVLHKTFPQVVVHRFGSTLIGLAFGNSDVDLFLSNISESETKTDKLFEIKRLLMKSRLFANCLVIASAKIPIVKCLHIKTNIQCDINIKSRLGVHNSALIRHYLSADAKVRNAMIIIKYWGKCQKLTGRHKLFTNYCLTLMFIFFLQREPYRFPSVYSIQAREHHEGIWPDSVTKDHEFNTERIKATPLKDIVRHFFEFYAKFDFTKIISLYLGEALPLTYFESPETMSSCYETYRQLLEAGDEGVTRFQVNCPVSVQDPFEHDRNVSASVALPVLQRFQLAVKRAAEIFSQDQRILYTLYTEKVPDREPTPCTVGVLNDDVLELKLAKGGNLRYLTLHPSNDDDEDQRWFECLKRFVLMVFKDFLLFTEEEASDDPIKSKGSKGSNQKDIHDTVEYTLSTNVNLWNSRRLTAKQLDLNGTNSKLVERELAITQHLYKSVPLGAKSTKFISFKMKMVRGEATATIYIQKISSYKKSFKSFVCFIQSMIPVWLEQYQNDLSNDALKASQSS